MAMRPSSPSFSNRFSYDVFLSFRGEDTRYGFTGSLCDALRKKGILTFMDDVELQRGDEITPTLEKAIEESRIFIVVLSENYASSSFCLNELAHIHKFKEEKGVLVIPIFHKVDPSDVRNQKGEFGEALAKHVKKYDPPLEKLEAWKKALNEVANLSGYTFKADGEKYEHKFIEEIVQFVSRKINRTPLHLDNDMVGLDSQVQQVKELLDVGSDDIVHMVGIHGPGGMGKTTLAVAVYNSIAHNFKALCYLANVRETSKQHGLTHLQSILLSKTVGEKEIKITSEEEGSSEIKHRLQNNKVLLILDDVDDIKQLEATIGSSDWFGGGSGVIITTRDKQLLACHGVERTYQVKKLEKEDAAQLLSSKAFKSKKIDPRYQDVLNEAVTYASGLPLALKVIGSNLCGKPIELWESALNDYKRIPHKKIQDVLKVSYDGLGEEEQSVFLDIACCFKGYTLTEVEDILRAHYDGHCMKNRINVLVDRSLISICHSTLTLHDLIEDMGKEIVRQESPKDPGERSRLWFREDIVKVLEENKGTSQIEIIHMDFGDFKKVEWDGNAFKEMKNLKTLVIKGWRNVFSTGPKHLPNSLRVLMWCWHYPSENFPKDFYPKKLAICNLVGNKCISSGFVTLSGKKFTNLTSLNFDYCQYLTEIPDVSGLKGLKALSFASCDNLLTVHESVGLLEKLRILSAGNCRKLKSFPLIKSTSLEELDLGRCKSLESFPEVSGKMENIKYLSLDETSIKEFPLSFENLTGLEELDLSKNKFEILPECFKEFRSLTTLNLNDCGSLQEILGIPPNLKVFNASRCDSLTSSCISMLFSQELHEAGYTNFCLPDVKIPEWFERQSRGLPISFRVRKELPAIAICFHMASVDDYSLLEYEGAIRRDFYEYLYRLEDGLVYSIIKYNNVLKRDLFISLILIINGKEHDCFTFYMHPDETYLFDLREILVKPKERTEDKLNEALSKQEWINVQIIYKCYGKRIIMKSGIHVLKEQCRDDIHFIDDLNSSDTESENMKVAEAKKLCWSYDDDDDDDDDRRRSWVYPVHSDVFPKKSRFTSPELVGFLSKKKFINLTNLNFDECQCLTEIPDVSFLQQLEKLSFQQCCNLSTIHESVGSMEKLKILKARCCCKLKSFPRIKLTSLEQLHLALCHRLESFPEISVKMENITKLNLDGTRINLTGLQQLEDTSSYRDAAIFIRNISMRPKEDESVEKVSSTVSSNIQHLSLRQCNLSDEFFPIALQWFANVKELDLSENNFTVIPESIKACRFLTKLMLERCRSLQEIRGVPPNLKHFSATGCLSLTSLSKSMLLDQELHEAGNTNFYLPGADIPKWFEYQMWEQSISFRFYNKLPAIAICLVREDEDEVYVYLTVITNGHTYYYFRGESMGKGTTRLLDLREFKYSCGEPLLGNGWSHAKITCEKNLKSIPVKCGIHVLKQQSSVEDIQFMDPQIKRKLESQNQQLMKKQRLVDMEVADTALTLAVRTANENAVMGAIRKWKGPEQVRTLLWELGTDALLTNQVRYMRDSTADPSCHICGNDVESTDHVFRHCGIARAVWYLLLPAPKHTTFFTQDRDQWMIHNLRDDQMMRGRRWSLIFAVALDMLWQINRNCFIFQNCRDLPKTIYSKILVKVDAIVEEIDHFEHMELSL